MTQQTDRVWQVDCLKAGKAKTSKFHKKEKVAYIEAFERDQEYDVGYKEVGETDTNMAELNLGFPYVCKWLKLSDRKNPVEP